MSLTITLVTTANRTRRFQQADPARSAAVLDSMQRCAQWFRQQSLVIIGNGQTEIINPSAITRIEIEAQTDLTTHIPVAFLPFIHAIPHDALTRPGTIEDGHAATRVEFFFKGGDTLSGWLQTPIDITPSDRTARYAHLFEEGVITYTTQCGGLGFINPGAMTRVHIDSALRYPPANAWQADEA